MRLPSIAIALALAACGTETPSPDNIVSGPNVATTMCPAGCSAGVEATIVSSKWMYLSDDVYEFAGELDGSSGPKGKRPAGTHGEFGSVTDPCGAVAHSGSCAEACVGGSVPTQAAGGSCVAIACPTEVVIARCDL